MIQKESYVHVIDNSGVKQLLCIHVGGGFRKRYANVGDFIIASVKSIRFKKGMKIKKGDVVRAVIIRTRRVNSLRTGIVRAIKNFRNEAVLISKQNKFLGTRIFGSVRKEFRSTRLSRVVALASGFTL